MRKPVSRSLRLLVATLVAACSLIAAAAPGNAVAATRSVVCTGSIVLSFVTTVTLVPGSRQVSLSGGGQCVGLGLGLGSAAWSVTSSTITALSASCEDLVLDGVTASVTVPNGVFSVTIVAGALSAAQLWVVLDNGGAANLQATGTFAWLATDEITACYLGAGTDAMTVTGAMAVVTG